jgi:hypothetical protein
MSERCILAVRFTPAGSLGQVRKAVGGFLRYVQHRDLHPTEKPPAQRPEISRLLKYVAYRDQASARAELFGPSGTIGNSERKAFAAFVLGSLEDSRPQPYRGRDGELVDRRRAVYRFVISPERAHGLDLRQLTVAAVGRLEKEAGVGGLRWMAAIHRNTAHPHVHLVIAGMRQQGEGFARLDLTRPRLAAMKDALGLEIQRERALGAPAPIWRRAATPASANQSTLTKERIRRPAARRHPARRSRRATLAISMPSLSPRRPRKYLPASAIVRQLQVAAARYRHQMQRELEDDLERRRREGWLR